MEIGDRIKARREELGLSLIELGKKCGIRDTTLRKYENGDRNPKIDTLRIIAKALNTNAFVLMGEEASKKLDTDTILMIADDEIARREDHAEDYDYLHKLSIPALKLNDLGRKLLLDNAETMASNTELIKNDGK